MTPDFSQAISRNFLFKTKIMIGVFCVILGLQMVGFTFAYMKSVMHYEVLVRAVYVPLFLLILVADQVFLLRYIRKKIRNGEEIRRSIILIASILETSFPTVVIAFGSSLVAETKTVHEMTILNSPPEYLYFVFIILSALLLDVRLPVIIGIIAGVEYLLLTMYCSGDVSSIEMTIMMFKPMIMVGFGVVTGLIARTIRNSVLESMETQRIMIEELDAKVSQRTAEINEQKEIIEEKQKEIIDSINYARRIQYTLLAHDEVLEQNLPGHFVLFKPKDIVSGDFYWCTKRDQDFYLAVCDCTGHGVPGAFMSLLNISFLNEAINEKNIREPNAVFDFVRERLIRNMEEGKDGMDAVLVRFSGMKMQYAAGFNHPLLVRNGNLVPMPFDKMPVGRGEKNAPFGLYEYDLQPGDQLFFYTDGFADQFGGPKGKKFKYSNLQQLLLENASAEPQTINHKLQTAFHAWKGDLEQVDDVCVIGVRF